MANVRFRLANAFLAFSTLSVSLYAGDAKNPLASDTGLRQAFERAIYSVKNSGDGTFRGDNPKQRLHVEFDERATRLQHAQGDVSFHLSGYGYGQHLGTPAEAKPAATANGVEYRRGELTEWYKNESSGLEQGFTLAHRPGTASESEPLVIALTLEGDLSPALSSTGDAVLLESAGKTILRYGGLRSWDARGRAVASRFEVQEGQVRLVIEDQNAQYPLVVDPTWIQQQELNSSDGAVKDQFGFSVSVDGDTAVIGAPRKNSAQGAAYVFVFNGTTWSQQAELTAKGGAAGDNFGNSVSVSGDTALIGAPYHQVGTNAGQGEAYVFARTGTTWTLQATPIASDGAASDEFGWSVAVSGGAMVIGAPGHKAFQGAAYVFVPNFTKWIQQAGLTASDGAAGDEFGYSVAVSGGTAVVGARLHQVGSNTQQGAAYVFVQSGTTWPQQAELTASDGAATDDFGVSVAVSGGTAVVGATGPNDFTGEAYVFVQSSTTWTQQAMLTAPDGAPFNVFGLSVAVSEGTAVIGAPQHKVGTNPTQGAAYVFVQSGTTWTLQPELTASDGAAEDNFGYSVSVSGSMTVVGAPFHEVGTNPEQGAAYVFVPPGAFLTVSKTDNVSGSTAYPAGWTWNLKVTNSGNATASFPSFTTLLTDNLPNSNISYGTATVTAISGGTGTLSCSINKPVKIKRFVIEADNPQWTKQQLTNLDQTMLFNTNPTEKLEKIPHKFKYEFQCNDPECNGHTMSCTDWEMADLIDDGATSTKKNGRQRFGKDTKMKSLTN